MEKYAADGRSTPGATQPNTGEVDIWYGPKHTKKSPARKQPAAAKK